MNETTKRYIISSVTTFLAVFLTTLGAQLQVSGGIEFTQAFFFGAVIIASRAGVKSVVENLPLLGNKMTGDK